jgi:hypothetical protein
LAFLACPMRCNWLCQIISWEFFISQILSSFFCYSSRKSCHCFLSCKSFYSEYRHHVGTVQDAYRLQLKLFLSEVRQQQLLSSIRSFLKLYTTISIAKLASFMDVDEPTLRYAWHSSELQKDSPHEYYIYHVLLHLPSIWYCRSEDVSGDVAVEVHRNGCGCC